LVEKFTTLLHDLKSDGEGRDAFYKLMSQFQDQRGRCFISDKPGAPEIDRTRGVSDKRKGSSKSISKTKIAKTKKRSAKKADVSLTSKRQKQHEGYETDDAHRQLGKFGAKEGWILECYPPDKLKTSDRWFMRVENGLTMKDAEGNTLIRSCQWLQSNSVTETDVEHRPASVDIMSVKGYGPPSFFKDIARQPSNPVAAVRSKSVAEAPPRWVALPEYGFSAQLYIQKKMSKSVDAVTFPVLRDAMKTALVPGTGAAKNKNDLIELMCKYDCEFIAQPHPVVRLANKQSSSQPAVTDGHAAIQPEIQTQKGINPAAAAAASKRFWAAAQTAKVPKHVSKKSAAASLFCTCKGAELRSEKCSFCIQFLLE
jgi:hypothetical protein